MSPAQPMTIGILGLFLLAFVVYVAFVPRETLEFHLSIAWSGLAVIAVVSLASLLLA